MTIADQTTAAVDRLVAHVAQSVPAGSDEMRRLSELAQRANMLVLGQRATAGAFGLSDCFSLEPGTLRANIAALGCEEQVLALVGSLRALGTYALAIDPSSSRFVEVTDSVIEQLTGQQERSRGVTDIDVARDTPVPLWIKGLIALYLLSQIVGARR